MYYQYFGLTEAPFSIAVNPRYLFMGARHRDALAHLLYGVGAGGGFILLTGEVGTGKTTINRCLLEQLPENTDIAMILNPALDALELLAAACDELGIAYDAESPTLKTLTDRLHAFLLENHARGRRTVLLIDEAQHLDFGVLEQIRLLTNLETNSEKLLQIILIGQPELAQMLARPELRQLNQRITARYNLEPLNREETAAYIRHRLQVAGLPPDRELFPRSVVGGVYRRTRGIPRLINVLCDRMLLGAYGRNRPRADASMLRAAAAEVLGDEVASPLRQRRWRLPAAMAAILLLAAVGWLGWREWWGAAGAPVAGIPAAGAPVAGTPVAGTPAKIVAPPPGDGGESPVSTRQGVETAHPAPRAAAPSGQGPPPRPAWQLPPEQGIATLWGLTTARPMPTGLCSRSRSTQDPGPVCVRTEAGTWEDLQIYSRPLLLDLVTAERFAASALLLGLDATTALLWMDGGLQSVPVAELGLLWNGTYSYLWQPPPGFSGPVALWEDDPVVAEIASMFAQLDGQPEALAGRQYNRALEARVRLFQQQEGLQADGVVGMRTLLKLNEALGIDPTSAEVRRRLQRDADEMVQR